MLTPWMINWINQNQQARSISPWFLIIIVLVVIILLLWYLGRSEQRSNPKPPAGNNLTDEQRSAAQISSPVVPPVPSMPVIPAVPPAAPVSMVETERVIVTQTSSPVVPEAPSMPVVPAVPPPAAVSMVEAEPVIETQTNLPVMPADPYVPVVPAVPPPAAVSMVENEPVIETQKLMDEVEVSPAEAEAFEKAAEDAKTAPADYAPIGAPPAVAVESPVQEEPITDGNSTVAAAGAVESETTQPAALEDLTLIEGIGPKIATVLREAGIDTFIQLAESPPLTCPKSCWPPGCGWRTRAHGRNRLAWRERGSGMNSRH